MLDKKCFEEKKRGEGGGEVGDVPRHLGTGLSISTSSQLHLSPSFRNDKTSILLGIKLSLRN
jgi:hypothetical protein